MNKTIIYILAAVSLTLISCRHTPMDEVKLSFSQDTIRMDTIFSTIGTPTHIIKVRNYTTETIQIQSIQLVGTEYFQVNVDGETKLENLSGMLLKPNDSISVFIRANVSEQGSNLPLFIEGKLRFILVNRVQQVVIQAQSQDVEILRNRHISRDTTLLGEKPYLVYGTLQIDTGKTLTIAPGCTFYMHDKAALLCYGTIKAIGEKDRRIAFQGDRLDNLFPHIPYRYVSGQWDGIYLIQPNTEPAYTHTLQYVDIQNGQVGLYLQNANSLRLSQVSVDQCLIHNFSRYGIALQNCNATVSNTEISNCASYCVYVAGGTQHFVYTTIASFFNQSYYIIQKGHFEDVAAVYIHDLNKDLAVTNAYFTNCVITGQRENNVVVATPFADRYQGTFSHCFLRADSLQCKGTGNVFQQANDTVFKNIFFDKDYHYYDFRLDSISPARGIADPSQNTLFPIDRVGMSRPSQNPNPGCYQ